MSQDVLALSRVRQVCGMVNTQNVDHVVVVSQMGTIRSRSKLPKSWHPLTIYKLQAKCLPVGSFRDSEAPTSRLSWGLCMKNPP